MRKQKYILCTFVLSYTETTHDALCYRELQQKKTKKLALIVSIYANLVQGFNKDDGIF